MTVASGSIEGRALGDGIVHYQRSSMVQQVVYHISARTERGGGGGGGGGRGGFPKTFTGNLIPLYIFSFEQKAVKIFEIIAESAHPKAEEGHKIDMML